ncbi:phenazine biosynthesis FMN-dependent oxidase PhzG [Streptomyces sp. MUM 178J]|uniref:phenazine biosynthesis FMN-dependent oxidase PhzG n=1 Tax=Streptomyces sp. MUM 178J TaxID=2791991 RepID=UPI001F0388A9|nr:phenazine biosynthesis FMN-dependent oxidase PhzG [Streptomyces sp. MUM 178J]WRQ83087.1 phenazine biosynthesis FMN-dependent oxidase PhzG [Streptomyces sp. MUM 178J]
MSSELESLTGVAGLDFPEYDDPPPEPMKPAVAWLKAAVESGVREPYALALATADASGRPSNRIVAVTDVSGEGLLFTTHSTSRKGREIAETGWASGLFYWRETARQLCVSGPVVRLDNDENDRLWHSRAPGLHPMTTASRQSEPFDDPRRLQDEADRYAAEGIPLPRPQRFVGYRLQPHSVEFWSAARSRLHRRLRYERTATGWQVARLQP